MDPEVKNVQKQMAEKLLEASKDKITRNLKDSVFCDLFSRQMFSGRIWMERRLQQLCLHLQIRLMR